MRRQHCICHCVHLLLCTDLLSHPTTKGIESLLQKLRNINHRLIFRHSELKQYDAENRQQKLLAAINEFVEIEEILDQEKRFYGVPEEDSPVIDLEENVTLQSIEFNSRFSGLARMNLTRWNSIPKMDRSHLKYQGKLLKIYS